MSTARGLPSAASRAIWGDLEDEDEIKTSVMVNIKTQSGDFADTHKSTTEDTFFTGKECLSGLNSGIRIILPMFLFSSYYLV